MRAALAALALVVGLAPAAHGEFDWPVGAHLPHHDLAVGVTGGLAFGEADGRPAFSGVGGIDLSYLHGVFGAHISLAAFPERTGVRVQPLAEVTFWYVALFGAGVSVAPMVGDVPSGVPPTAVALHVLLGVPIPLWSPGESGALVLVPFTRPGLRLGPRGAITGHHTVGVMLKWTSFEF